MNKSTHEPVGRYVSQLYRKGRAFISKELSEQGMGSGQFMFLLQLYKEDGISQEELSEKLSIDKGTTARAVKKLEEEGFINRVKDECDKRAYKVYLTEKSIQNKDVVYNVLQEWETIISQNITAEEREVLVSILKKICINQNLK